MLSYIKTQSQRQVFHKNYTRRFHRPRQMKMTPHVIPGAARDMNVLIYDIIYFFVYKKREKPSSRKGNAGKK